MNSAPITGVILAGGKSSRMGRDKALLPVGEKTLLEHILERFQRVYDEVLVSVNAPDRYPPLGVPAVADITPGCGPLSGLQAVLRAGSHPYCFVAACDMPFVEPAMGIWLWQQLADRYPAECAREHPAVVAVPSLGGRPEPLHALYGRGCLAAVERALARGDWKMSAFYDEVTVWVAPDDLLRRAFPDLEKTFTNVNTPADYQGMIQRPLAP